MASSTVPQNKESRILSLNNRSLDLFDLIITTNFIIETVKKFKVRTGANIDLAPGGVAESGVEGAPAVIKYNLGELKRLVAFFRGEVFVGVGKKETTKEKLLGSISKWRGSESKLLLDDTGFVNDMTTNLLDFTEDLSQTQSALNLEIADPLPSVSQALAVFNTIPLTSSNIIDVKTTEKVLTDKSKTNGKKANDAKKAFYIALASGNDLLTLKVSQLEESTGLGKAVRSNWEQSFENYKVRSVDWIFGNSGNFCNKDTQRKFDTSK